MFVTEADLFEGCQVRELREQGGRETSVRCTAVLEGGLDKHWTVCL